VRVVDNLRAAAGSAQLIGSSVLHRSLAPRSVTAAPVDDSGLAIRWPSAYEWAHAPKWVEGLRVSLSERVPVTVAEIAQPFEGAVVIEVQSGGDSRLVAIDYFDKDRVLDGVRSTCRLVFKMQYRIGGYDDSRIVPGGYVPGQPYLERYVAGLRHIRRTAPPRFDVYGRFSAGYAPGVRQTAVELMRNQQRVRYEGELALLRYSAYLKEAARSLVCLDLPGNGDMCHRLVDYLAIGCCIVRPQPVTRLPVPLTDGVNVRYVATDLSDLVDTCAELVADPDRSRAMGLAAAEYFDTHLQSEALAAWYISQLRARLAPTGDQTPAATGDTV
jgi:hypothetical protein